MNDKLERTTLQPELTDERRVFEALRAGYHNRSAASIAGVYAEDAEITIINRNNPPSKRLVVRGRDAVQKMYEDICAREMTHHLENATVGAGSIAYSMHCRYPDGCEVVGLNQVTVVDGLIVRELNVNCWDE